MTQTPEDDRQQAGGADPGRDSAPRRTYLAAERTYLAWLRTGLASIGIAMAVGRLIPALIDASQVAFAVLGIGYALLGIFLILYAAASARRIHRALEEGRPLPSDWAAILTTTAGALVLATITMVMLVVEI
jgi:putative membrane protein